VEHLPSALNHRSRGLISAALKLVLAQLSVFGVRLRGVDPWQFPDAAFILALAYGI